MQYVVLKEGVIQRGFLIQAVFGMALFSLHFFFPLDRKSFLFGFMLSFPYVYGGVYSARAWFNYKIAKGRVIHPFMLFTRCFFVFGFLSLASLFLDTMAFFIGFASFVGFWSYLVFSCCMDYK